MLTVFTWTISIVNAHLKYRAECERCVYQLRNIEWASTLEDKVKEQTIEIQKQNSLLIATDKKKDEFLANTSHELRTPLNGIIGLTSHLMRKLEGDISSKYFNDLNAIHKSGARLNQLINDILDFSKIQNDGLDLKIEVLSIQQIVDDVLNISKYKLDNNQVSLINDTEASTPPVRADKDRLLQILHNLLSNAVKFTPYGSVTVTAQQRGGLLEISVKDTGIGVPDNKISDIFMPFEQANGSISREYGGTGLGLSITKDLVEMQGGHIGVMSQEGLGSTFYFTLPLADSSANSTKEQAAYPDKKEIAKDKPGISENNIGIDSRLPIPQESGLFNSSLLEIRKHLHYVKDASILIVDDDPINLQVTQNILEDVDCHVVTVLSGEEALLNISGQRPDLVLLDIMMPGLSGYETAKKIREIEPVLPIIMLTALQEGAGSLGKSSVAGANDFLSKPYSEIELLARIESQLKLSRYSHQLEEEILVRTAEAERNLKYAMHAEKQQSLNTLVAGVAHEINTPLGSALLVSTSLDKAVKSIKEYCADQEMPDAETTRFIEKTYSISSLLVSTLNRTANLVKQFKTISVDQANDRRQEFAIAEYCQGVVDSLAPRLKEIQHELDISVELQLECQISDSLNGFPGAIAQVLQNLVINAYYHAFDRKRTGLVHAEIYTESNELFIIIKDNGDGMSKEIQAQIFTPFFTTKVNTVGVGLGMTIVYNLVEQVMGGTIECFSQIDQGTKFTLRLPLHQEAS